MSTDHYSEAALALLAPMLRSLVDNKQQLGVRYAQWCTGAPTLESATAATAMAQAELGHSRALLPVLDELAAYLPADALGDDRTLVAMACLDHQWNSWAELVAANAIIDSALTVFVQSALDTPYTPFQTRTRKMIDEERFHTVHGVGWVQKLARLSDESHAAIAQALRNAWPEALCWFGPSGGNLDQLHAAGMIDADADTLRQRLLERCAATIAASDVQPNPDDLPWEWWDATTRRLEATQ